MKREGGGRSKGEPHVKSRGSTDLSTCGREINALPGVALNLTSFCIRNYHRLTVTLTYSISPLQALTQLRAGSSATPRTWHLAAACAFAGGQHVALQLPQRGSTLAAFETTCPSAFCPAFCCRLRGGLLFENTFKGQRNPFLRLWRASSLCLAPEPASLKNKQTNRKTHLCLVPQFLYLVPWLLCL